MTGEGAIFRAECSSCRVGVALEPARIVDWIRGHVGGRATEIELVLGPETVPLEGAPERILGRPLEAFVVRHGGHEIEGRRVGRQAALPGLEGGERLPGPH